MVVTAIQDSDNVLPITIEAYHLLYERGLIPEKAELIEGVIFSKMPKNPIHSEILRKLNLFLYKNLSEKYIISSENPITIEDSESEPDIAILPEGNYSKEHPKFAILIIEIANTSLSFDRKKAYIYDKGNIPEYLIFNLNDLKIEAYKNPRDGIYTEIKILSKDELFLSTNLAGLQFSFETFCKE
ncbi:MAG: Uma2 family endonuclease [Leptospiraceae bacterium]|nr:Uma2 family endonuclease [Leptospiraceae bacterium]